MWCAQVIWLLPCKQSINYCHNDIVKGENLFHNWILLLSQNFHCKFSLVIYKLPLFSSLKPMLQKVMNSRSWKSLKIEKWEWSSWSLVIYIYITNAQIFQNIYFSLFTLLLKLFCNEYFTFMPRERKKTHVIEIEKYLLGECQDILLLSILNFFLPGINQWIGNMFAWLFYVTFLNKRWL